MARYVIVTPVTVAGSGYAQPPRVLRKGDVVELTATEVTAIGGGNMRSAQAARAVRRAPVTSWARRSPRPTRPRRRPA
jgi:hypothetical protein